MRAQIHERPGVHPRGGSLREKSPLQLSGLLLLVGTAHRPDPLNVPLSRLKDPTGAVAFVRLVPEVAETSQAFAPFSVSGARFVTVKKRPEDGTWCVWGLGDRMVAAEPVLEG
jgi:hypothetical protein